MVGIVIISHSKTLADGVLEVARMAAPTVPMRSAGGLADGSLGTSFERIAAAAAEVETEDGVVFIMDMGSAVMTAEMVKETLDYMEIGLLDAPLVEGAVLAAAASEAGASLDEILARASEARALSKLGDGL